MDKQRIEYENKFTDFAECTEYCYDEFGKLNVVRASGDISKKEGKYLHKRIMDLLKSSLDDIDRKRKANDMVDKTEVKEFNKEYKKEHSNSFSKAVKATLSFPKRLINFLTRGKKCNQVELIPAEQAEALNPPSNNTQDTPEANGGRQNVQNTHICQQSTSEEVVVEDANKKAE